MSLATVVQHVRVNNTNFSAYPWSTEDICRVEDLPTLLGRDSPTYALALKLKELEQKTTPPVKEDQYSLFAEQMRGRTVLGASSDHVMDSVYKTLMAYKLLDLDLASRGSHLRTLSSGPTLPIVSTRTKLPLDELNDLKKIITRSRKDLQDREKDLAKKNRLPGPTASSSAQLNNPLLALYANFARSVQKKRVENTLINLSAASIHLAYLLRGNVYLPGDTTLIEDFILSFSTSGDDHDEMRRIRADYETDTHGCSSVMHKTLFLALAVSPLMLIVPRSYEQSVGKAAILETWSQFGSIVRPPSVESAETAVWKILFGATKGGDVLAHLKTALSDLEPALGHGTSPWFTLSSHKPVPHASTSQTSHVVEVENSSEEGSAVTPGQSHPSGPGAVPAADGLTADVELASPLLPQHKDSPTNPASSGIDSITSTSPDSSEREETTAIQSSIPTAVVARAPSIVTQPAPASVEPPSSDGAPIAPLPQDLEQDTRIVDADSFPAGVSPLLLAGSDHEDDSLSVDRTLLPPVSPSPYPSSGAFPPFGRSILQNVSPGSMEHDDHAPVDAVSGGGSPPMLAGQGQTTDTGYIDPSVLQTRPPSPVLAPKPSVYYDKPVTRSSNSKNVSVPKPLTSSAQPKPPKRPTKPSASKKKTSKRPSKKVKKETTAADPGVPRSPVFIDLTLENSDNELSDPQIELNTQTGFVTGDHDVTYPLAGSSAPYTWTPRFHFNNDLAWFYKLDAAVQRSASRPAPIKQLTHAEYSALPPSTLFDLLKTNACIVVVDETHRDPGFSREVFTNFCRLEETTTIQDFSVPDGPTYRKGTVLDLLEASRLPNPPALSALNLPSAYDLYPKLPFSSDWAVWQQVQGEAYCRSTDLYPIPDLRWSIASTGSAYHFWHVDANGLVTFVKLECGKKLWYIAVPKDGDFTTFMQPDLLTKIELDESNQDLWDVYVIVLHPGTTLLMRPTLPHCVVTPEPSFCSGGHSVAVSTIPYTIVGAYTHYISASSYTNTDHFKAAHSALMRLLVFYQLKMFADPPEPSPHMPDPSTWDGFLIVLYLCAYFELASALLGWDYAENVRGFQASIKNRSRARMLLYQLFSRFTFIGPEGPLTGMDAFYKIYSVFLVHHARLIVQYKELAVLRKVRGGSIGITVADVTSDVYRCIRGGPASLLYGDSAAGDVPTSFAWHGPVYDIQLNIKPEEYAFPYASGFVYGDVEMARSFGFKISPEDVAFVVGNHELEVEEDETDGEGDGDYDEMAVDGDHGSDDADDVSSLSGHRAGSHKRSRSASGSQSTSAPKKPRQT
ncbi:hypothetical protein FPV67DRAFT_1449541 [Lyophyllum atratum]|nr:hypothetical protein FPV67DRAFT_1449541 [Lyophyllum atratum]